MNPNSSCRRFPHMGPCIVTLALSGFVAACGNDGPSEPGPTDPGPGSPDIEITMTLDGDRGRVPYSLTVEAHAQPDQQVQRLIVTMDDSVDTVYSDSYSASGMVENMTPGPRSIVVKAEALPDRGNVGTRSASVQLLPPFVEQEFVVRSLEVAYWSDGVGSEVVQERGGFPSGVLVVGDEEIPFVDGVGAISPSDSVEVGQRLVDIVVAGRPVTRGHVLFEVAGDPIPLFAVADWSGYDLGYEELHTFLWRNDEVRRWHRPAKIAFYDGWARGSNPEGGGGAFEVTPEIVGADSAQTMRFPAATDGQS